MYLEGLELMKMKTYVVALVIIESSLRLLFSFCRVVDVKSQSLHFVLVKKRSRSLRTFSFDCQTVKAMSRQPRFEELDEDAEDPDELDLPEFPSSSLSRNDFPQPSTGGLPPSAAAAAGGFNKPQMISPETLEQYKNWPCIYPVYFDATRSLQEGRRVPLKLAVENPLAKELASAAASLNIRSIFEVHP